MPIIGEGTVIRNEEELRVWHLSIRVHILVSLLKKDPHLSWSLSGLWQNWPLSRYWKLPCRDFSNPNFLWFSSCVSGCSFTVPFTLPHLLDLWKLAGFKAWSKVTSSTMAVASVLTFHSLFYGWLVFHCVSVHHVFTHSSVDGHLGGIHVVAIVNSAAVNIGVSVSFQISFLQIYIQKWDYWIIWQL